MKKILPALKQIQYSLRYFFTFAWILFIFLCRVPAGITADDNSQTSPTNNSEVSSTFKGYKAPATTQKSYKIKNDGRNKNSQVMEYASTAPFKVYEDKDLDKNYGEKEARGVDLDNDGRKGEQEKQLGTENVTQNQKVAILNNMGIGNSLSDFKVPGQTQRSSVFVDEDKFRQKTESIQDQSAEEQTPSKIDETAQAKKKPSKSRVLVG